MDLGRRSPGKTEYFFSWLNCWHSAFYNCATGESIGIVSNCLELSPLLFELRDCIWIIWLETGMSWDKYASISVTAADDILFLNKMGKAGIWKRPAPWPGWGSNVQNVSWCSKFPSSERHPLPQFPIWEMGGSQWNYCVTKIASSHFLGVQYSAESMAHLILTTAL